MENITSQSIAKFHDGKFIFVRNLILTGFPLSVHCSYLSSCRWLKLSVLALESIGIKRNPEENLQALSSANSDSASASWFRYSVSLITICFFKLAISRRFPKTHFKKFWILEAIYLLKWPRADWSLALDFRVRKLQPGFCHFSRLVDLWVRRSE